MTSQMQPESESGLDKLLKTIRESENILRGIRLAAVVEGMDVGQCKYRMIDMLEGLLLKIFASTWHQKQDLELHRYPTGDARQLDWNMQARDPQECIQTTINNTMRHSIGRAVSVTNVAAERGSVAMSARANQYDDSNALQLMGSELVRNVSESSIHAIGSIVGHKRETVQYSNVGTQAEYPEFCSGLTINFSDGLPEETQTYPNCRIRDALDMLMSQRPMPERAGQLAQLIKSRCNSNAITPVEEPYTSYPQHPAANFSDISIGTSIGSKIMRDEHLPVGLQNGRRRSIKIGK